jgi:hypothetical protein
LTDAPYSVVTEWTHFVVMYILIIFSHHNLMPYDTLWMTFILIETIVLFYPFKFQNDKWVIWFAMNECKNVVISQLFTMGAVDNEPYQASRPGKLYLWISLLNVTVF